MKEEINLLPPNILKKRARSLYTRRFNRFVWVFAVSLVIINFSMLAINFSLKDSLRVISEESIVMAETQGDATLVAIKDTNELVNTFQEKVQEYDPWLVLIKDVVDVKPSNTSITSLSLEEKEDRQSLVIQATSSSRSEVVSWQQDLESLDWIERVEAPLQNFATGPNSSFTFTLYREEK